MAFGIQLRLTHTGVSPSNILIDDIRTDASGGRRGLPAEYVYLPAPTVAVPNPQITLTFGSLVPMSFERGDIRGYITQGLITAEFLVGGLLQDASDGPVILTATAGAPTPDAFTGTVNDSLFLVSTVNDAVQITLPAGAAHLRGRFRVIDIGGNASVNNIILVAAGGDTINGLATYTVATNNGLVEFVWDEVGNWFIPVDVSDGAVDPAMGNVVRVDQVYGNDATGSRSGKPFLTITAAIAAALSGDLVWIGPGIYNESITLKTGVALRGMTVKGVTIQRLAVTADTTLVTMATDSRLEDVTLKLTSAQHHTLVGIHFPTTSSATAKWRTAVLTVDNSTAGVGASTVTGVWVDGTGAPTEEISAIRACNINVLSAGTGPKRGVLVTGATSFFIRDVTVLTTCAASLDCFGCESNNAGAILGIDSGTIAGTTADISQTLGRIQLSSAAVLQNMNANGLGVTPKGAPRALVYADAGALPAGTRFMRPGTATVGNVEMLLPVTYARLAISLHILALTGPGGARTDTVTLRKNGADTGITVSLTGAATTAAQVNVSVTYAPGDTLSIKIICAAGSTLSDVVVATLLF